MTGQNLPAAGEAEGMARVREMRRVSERSHRMSCSDPDDPARRTLYKDAVDLADALEAVDAIIRNAGERYGAAGVLMGEEISRAVADAVRLPDSVRFVPGRGPRA
ncbi:hypothetical protein [Arthrobacter sp. zg-Y1110]|uniref:hypothetical protein n=1 Tax=Arthrobacter sp. zg-Y1110 TaxID=2886932 RepID=UPI001D148055|nr:hypothetical protein [Arthrobacter sp. zg-Y1110]MCC3292462.1 hypothetical protein [Arthrobacter sp. zg-Y1110]UWX87105.1 hypothetical protein N2K99_17300 [Arthrobacter sp. zg-Y1110]